MVRWLVDRVNLWVLLGAVIVAGVVLFAVLVLVYVLPPPAQSKAPVSLTVIPAPTPTATLPAITPTPTPTEPVTVGGISVGTYVEITGTEGAGLRLREGPGTSNPMRFIGMDSEVFLVKDGPQESDGFTWWYLEAPYDPNRTGWAAGQYLTVVNQPVEPTSQ